MPVFDAIFTASSGQSFSFGYKAGVLYSIDPIGDLPVELETSQGYQQVGATVESRSISGVTRTITGRILRNTAYLKRQLRDIFTPGATGRLTVAGKYYCDATVTVGAESTAGIARRELVVDAASRTRSSSQTQSDYLESLKALGTQELAKHTRLENFRFTPTDEVMVGKVVAASLPGTDIQAAARITSITLTSQKGENSVSTEIGTPIIRRRT